MNVPLMFLGRLLLRFLHGGISTDSCMNLFVHLLNALRFNSFFDVFTEVRLILLRFLIH